MPRSGLVLPPFMKASAIGPKLTLNWCYTAALQLLYSGHRRRDAEQGSTLDVVAQNDAHEYLTQVRKLKY